MPKWWSAKGSKKYRPKRTFKKRWGGRGLQAFKSVINKSLRPELKYSYTNVSGVAAATGGNVGYLNNIPQGNTALTRVGDRLVSKYIQYDVYCIAPSTVAYEDSGMLTFFADKGNNNVDPVYGDVYDIVNTRIGQCLRLTQYMDRFVVLKTVPLGPVNQSHCENNRFRGFIKIPLDLALTQFAAGGTRPIQNSIMYGISSVNNTGLTTTSMTFNISLRFAYSDS